MVPSHKAAFAHVILGAHPNQGTPLREQAGRNAPLNSQRRVWRPLSGLACRSLRYATESQDG